MPKPNFKQDLGCEKCFFSPSFPLHLLFSRTHAGQTSACEPSSLSWLSIPRADVGSYASQLNLQSDIVIFFVIKIWLPLFCYLCVIFCVWPVLRCRKKCIHYCNKKYILCIENLSQQNYDFFFA